MFVPARRDYKANLNFNAIDSWNGQSRFLGHYLNGLSAFFPAGERFFIDAVRHYRKSIEHVPFIEQSVKGFIGQEVQHGRMHDQYDEALALAGYPSKELERIVEAVLQKIQRTTSHKFQLALTAAAEHYTAMMANHLLESQMLDGAEESYAWLWKVHAVEEIEHRSVTFDVYDHVGDYSTRMLAYFITSAILMPVFVASQLANIICDKESSIFDIKEWAIFGIHLSKMIASMVPDMIAYCAPDYHPDMMRISPLFTVTKAEVFA